MNTREIVENQVKEAMESGLYKIASLDMFDMIDQIRLSDKMQLHLEYTNELLYEYLNEIMELDGKKPGLLEFLKTIRAGDMIDNQSLEKENSFLIGLYSQMSRETAMGRLIKFVKNDKQLNGRDVFSIHNTLLYGTLSDDGELVRTRNDKFVGRISNGQRIIDYFPIDCKDIKVAANKLAELYNMRLSSEEFDNVFFQPFLIHGLFGALQLFSDGNTRMGRVMQHALMWQLINERTEFNFEMPPLFTTRSYYPLRGEYRGKIASLVRNNNSDAWNDWFDFNLCRVEDSIYAARENINILKRKING